MFPAPRLALRLPGVRLALVLVVILPAFVAWWGPDVDAGLRLRLGGAAAAIAVALVWDDRSAITIAATPVGLPAVRRGRTAIVALLLASAWSLAAAVAVRTADLVPVGPLGLEAVAVSALLLGLTGGLARGREGEPVAAYPVIVLLAVLALQFRAPQGWQLITAGPVSGDVQRRWLIVLAASLVLIAWVGRDLGARSLRPSAAQGSGSHQQA